MDTRCNNGDSIDIFLHFEDGANLSVGPPLDQMGPRFPNYSLPPTFLPHLLHDSFLLKRSILYSGWYS